MGVDFFPVSLATVVAWGAENVGVDIGGVVGEGGGGFNLADRGTQ